MATSIHNSAGVYVSEEDLSQRVNAASTSSAAIVGGSAKGPVMKRTLITGKPQFLSLFGNPDPSISYMHYCALPYIEESAMLYVTRVVATDTLSGGAYLTVDDATAVAPILDLTNFDNGSSIALGKWDPFNTLSFDPTQAGTQNILGFFCAENPGMWNNNIYINVRPNLKAGATTPDDPFTFYVDVYLNYVSSRQPPNESFLVSRDYRVDGFMNQLHIEDVINSQSNIIRYVANPYAAAVLPIVTSASVFFAGATNGSPVTDSIVINGWELYRDPEAVTANILINGGYSSPAVQMEMADIASSRMDAVAVLDQPSTLQQVADVMNYRRNTLNLDTSYAAMYTPDLLVYDQYSDRSLYIPPSGFVAAAYARTDNDFATWFAVAGMIRGNLGVQGVRVVYNQVDRDALDSVNVNPVRSIPNVGFRIWGAATLQVEASAESDVNVRRLLNFLESSISAAALYSVFDPNDPILWAKLVELCERFLTPIKNGQGLNWFEVVCDTSNNTPATIATGDTILEVYLDPVLPAKRILLTASINKTGVVYSSTVQAAQ